MHSEFMAEWEHKERNWSMDAYEAQSEGDWIGRGSSGRWRNRDFASWLDWQCKGGWEVFKISRDFNGDSGTWCIFRKKN